MNSSHFVWVEKYRPLILSDVILPSRLKDKFKSFIEQKEIPPVLFTGPPGCGKTTVAKVLTHELEVETMFVPASLNRGIDMLRTDITPFASSVSWNDKRKYVILDEADNLTFDTQKALRNFMEEYALTTGFILTANYPKRLDAAIISRGPIIDFTPTSEEALDMCVQFLRRLEVILKNEGLEYDKKDVARIVHDRFPDFRGIIGLLQHSIIERRISLDFGSANKSYDYAGLFRIIRNKDFYKLRQWVAERSDSDFGEIYRGMYEQADAYFTKLYLPQFILTISDYMFKSSMVKDQEINFCAFCIEVWKDADWLAVT